MNRGSAFRVAVASVTSTVWGRFLPRWASLLLAGLAGAASVSAAPYITGFNQLYGSPSDGPFLIFGSGFYPSTTRSISFGGVAASYAYPLYTNSAYALETYVPAGAPVGPVAVVVTIDGLATQSYWNFYVVGAGPYIHDFSPAAGGDGVTVTLTGEHFAGATSVTFNGLPATLSYIGFDTHFTVTTPIGVTTGPITVTTPNGSFTTTSNYFAPSMISGFSPVAGAAGTIVTLTGVNFLGATCVAFNGVQVPVSPLNNTTLQVVAPVGVTTGPIAIITPANPFVTSSNFVVLPAITGFTPNAGPPGTSVTILGANFTDGGAVPVVKFNGLGAVVGGFTGNQISATVPVGATTGPVTVTTTNGTATSASSFYLPPTISSFTPASGAAGSWVRINGANFLGASAVSFNGLAAAAFNVTNNSTLGALLPTGVTTGPISVTTPGGTANSGSLLFYGTPAIASFAPLHGLAGTNVVVTGLNLQGATTVSFNGQSASFTLSNNTTLSVRVPPNPSSGPIQVVTGGGTAVSATAFVIDTSDLAVAVKATASPIAVGGNLTYVITVTNAGPYTAFNARLGDTLPALTNLGFRSTTLGTFSTNTYFPVLVCTFGDLPAGGSAVITLVNKAPLTPGLVTNIASVAADLTDPVPLNNVVTNFTLVQSLPLLSIQELSTNLVQITWPPDLTNFQLQFKSQANTNVPVWTNDAQAPVISNLVSGSRLTVTETNTDASRFYRLKR